MGLKSDWDAAFVTLAIGMMVAFFHLCLMEDNSFYFHPIDFFLDKAT